MYDLYSRRQLCQLYCVGHWSVQFFILQRARLKTARKLEQHWLDFGTNKYTPYALQGGATDLHMPFVVQVPLRFAGNSHQRNLALACNAQGDLLLRV